MPPVVPDSQVELCQPVYLKMSEFGSFTIAEMRNNRKMQNMMETMTHDAVALSAADNGVYRYDFWMNFSNVSGSLSIEHNMCSWYMLHLTALKYIIQNEDEEINAAMMEHLNTSKTVTISINKLSHRMVGVSVFLHCVQTELKHYDYVVPIRPTNAPTSEPTTEPSRFPTFFPTMDPSNIPTTEPTVYPSWLPLLSLFIILRFAKLPTTD